jgi:hypothetical protein
MANGVYVRGRYVVGQHDVDALVLQLMLVSTGYAYASTGQFVDDGSTNDPKSYEIAPSGYARQALASLALFETTSDFVGLDAADVTYTALAAGATIGGAVLYRYSTSGGTTSDTGQDLVSFYDVTDTPTNGGDITIQWASTSAGSVLKLGTTA